MGFLRRELVLWLSLVAVCGAGPIAEDLQAATVKRLRSVELGLGPAPTVVISRQDNATLLAQAKAVEEAAALSKDAIPYQVAEPIPVKINVLTQGESAAIAGGKLFRLRIESKGAHAIHLLYDRWQLARGAELYVHNDSRSQIEGPYTSLNNWIDSTNVTPPTAGDAVTIEYFVPNEAEAPGELHVATVLHHFRGGERVPGSPLDSLGESDSCIPGINCPDGASLQTWKRSVARLYMPSGGVCTGTLINDAVNSSIPYFLTARHCYPTDNGTNFLVQFDYESPTCATMADSDLISISNASVLVRYENSDVMLLRLSSPPPASYSPFYAGWNRSVNQPATPVWGIHHPMDDVKKMMRDDDAPESSDWNGNFDGYYWRCYPDVGGTQSGSSGSALFDANGSVYGTLTGHSSDWDVCDFFFWNKYGKFSDSWYGGGTPETALRFWLDPFDAAPTAVSGFVPPVSNNGLCEDAHNVTYFPFYDSGYTWGAPTVVADCFSDYTQQLWYHVSSQECKKLITVDLCGSLFDTEIRVMGYDCHEEYYHTDVVCENWGNSNCPESWIYSTQQGRVTFQLPEMSDPDHPHDYYIGVMGVQGPAQAGYYQIAITAQDLVATNDQCPGLNITNLPYTWSGNTNCATNNYSPSCASDGGAPDVVFRFYAPCDGTFLFSTCGSSFNTVLELKQVSAPYTCSSPMTLLDCNNNDFTCSNGLNSKVVATLTQGTICYLYLDGVNGASGDYVLNVEEIGQNFERCPGRTITSLPYQHVVNNQCMVDDYVASCGGQWGYDGVYVYTPTQPCRDIQISSRFSIPTIISVRTGGACPGDNELSCHVFDGGTNSRFTMQASEGVTYYIIVDTEIGTYGSYNLEVVDMGPSGAPNDGCFGAPMISALPYVDSGDTRCATYDFYHCGGGTAPEVLYRLQLPCTRFVTANLCGSDYDTRLDVRMGEGCAGTMLVDCNDDDYCEGVPSLSSGVSWGAVANTEYYLIVHGYQAAAGHYVLTVTADSCLDVAPPAVDDLVVTTDRLTGNVTLTWGAVANGDVYEVYRSSSLELLYDPSSLLATVADITYTCAGCLLDPMNPSFFGVKAVNQPAALQYVDPMSRESKEPR